MVSFEVCLHVTPVFETSQLWDISRAVATICLVIEENQEVNNSSKIKCSCFIKNIMPRSICGQKKKKGIRDA